MVNELSSYTFSPLREGDIALYRGSGNGLAPILLAAAEETSLGCVEQLKHEFALKAELDADWAARPVALTHYNDRMTLVLEDPGGVPVDRLLGRPLGVTFYQMLTGQLPFSAADPLEWVHSQIARQPMPPDEGLGPSPGRCLPLPCTSRPTPPTNHTHTHP